MVVISCSGGCELNWAQMGVCTGPAAEAELGGVVFSLSRLGVLFGSFDCLFLENMPARLFDDLVFGFSAMETSSRARLGSLACLSLGLSLSFSLPSDRSDTELRVFLCRLFAGMAFESYDLRGDGGLATMSWSRVVDRSWLCGWSGGSNGTLLTTRAVGLYGLLSVWFLCRALPSEGARL